VALLCFVLLICTVCIWIGWRGAALKTVRASAQGLEARGLLARRVEVPYGRILRVRRSFWARSTSRYITVYYVRDSGKAGKLRFRSRYVLPWRAKGGEFRLDWVHPDVAWLRETVADAQEAGDS